MLTSEASPEPQTWHHGLVAKWWAEFETDGPEIDYFRSFVEAGQPALDVGCGTGRKEPPWHDDWTWPYWANGRRGELPTPWPDQGTRRTASDGTEYELRGRIVDIDPLAQRVTLELRGSRWRDGTLIEQDDRAHVLTMTEFFADPLREMLARAGFSEIEMRGDRTDQSPTSDTASIVFIARKPVRPSGG